MPRGRPFRKGERPVGRAKGVPNKSSASIKAAVLEAFDRLGGVDALVAWGRDNPTDFYKLAARLIPTEVKADVGGLNVVVQRFASEMTDDELVAMIDRLESEPAAGGPEH